MREFALVSLLAAALDVMEAQLLLLSLVPFLKADKRSDYRRHILPPNQRIKSNQKCLA
jgi:hypothetical protein